MKKYGLVCFLAMVAVAESKVHVGVKTTVGYSRNSMLTTSITDSDKQTRTIVPNGDLLKAYTEKYNHSFSANGNFLNMDTRSLNVGLLTGYTFENLHKVYKPYVELDVDLVAKTYKQDGIDFDRASPDNSLNNESFKVRSSAVSGLTLGVDAAITDSVSAIVATRFTLTRYTATASHVFNNESLLPANSLTRNAYLFGFEPMVGTKYKFNDNMALRFTAGYNFGQTKTIIKNYVTDVGGQDPKTSAGLTLKPRSLNFTVALIYTF